MEGVKKKINQIKDRFSAFSPSHEHPHRICIAASLLPPGIQSDMQGWEGVICVLQRIAGPSNTFTLFLSDFFSFATFYVIKYFFRERRNVSEKLDCQLKKMLVPLL